MDVQEDVAGFRMFTVMMGTPERKQEPCFLSGVPIIIVKIEPCNILLKSPQHLPSSAFPLPRHGQVKN